MTRIKGKTLEALLLAARNTYPNEFIALLGRKGKSRTINEYVLLPSIYGRTFSSIRLDLLPYNLGTVGSIHSHPSGSNSPSKADLKAFKAMGEIHLIIGSPFNLGSVRAFDKQGREATLEVVK